MQASEMPPPWSTCEAVLSEAFHLFGERGAPNLAALLRRRALLVAFTLSESLEPVVKLIEKYSNVPMGLADACLVRMTETLADPIILTTDQFPSLPSAQPPGSSLCDSRMMRKLN